MMLTPPPSQPSSGNASVANRGRNQASSATITEEAGAHPRQEDVQGRGGARQANGHEEEEESSASSDAEDVTSGPTLRSGKRAALITVPLEARGAKQEEKGQEEEEAWEVLDQELCKYLSYCSTCDGRFE